MKKSNLLFAAIAALLIGSCGQVGFEKTKSGLQYKIIKSGDGEKLEHGDFVKFQYKLTYKDSVVMSTYGVLPAFDQVDSIGRFHDFSEILTKLKVGDSVVTYQFHDSLQKTSQFGMPPYLKKGEKQIATLKIVKVYKTKANQDGRELAFADYQNEINSHKEKELAEIKKYVDAKNIPAQKLNNSVYVVMEKEGTGRSADSGLMVGIKYSGKSFEGKYFDSNVDSTKQTMAHPLETFYFVAKKEGAIQGMLEAITAFKVGSKGTLYVPSTLAYGPQGNPPVIKPYENLIFEIEVVEVKDAPAQQPQGMPPGGGGY
jgi:FKBP-type peptidyl-prolyl cis-trans isomerase